MDYNTQNNEYDFARAYFLPDEYEVWRGKSKGMNPNQKKILVPFGIFALIFAIFWMVTASRIGGAFGSFESSFGTNGFEGLFGSPRFPATPSKIGGIFGLFGLPFVAIALYLVFGRNAIGKNTYYVITNKKIYRSQAGRVDMVELANLPPMRIEGHSNGAGSIYFGEHHYRSHGKNHYGVVFSIENVDNIAEVQRIIAEQTKNY